MPTIGLSPSLSQVQTIPTELLRQAGSSWRATGAHWERVFTQLREQTSRDDVLEGHTGAAVRGRACDDWVIVQGKVFQLQEAAAIAELGSDRLAGAQARARCGSAGPRRGVRGQREPLGHRHPNR